MGNQDETEESHAYAFPAQQILFLATMLSYIGVFLKQIIDLEVVTQGTFPNKDVIVRWPGPVVCSDLLCFTPSFDC